jgi:hypothetical protein
VIPSTTAIQCSSLLKDKLLLNHTIILSTKSTNYPKIMYAAKLAAAKTQTFFAFIRVQAALL